MSVPKTPGDVAAINQEITRFLDQRDGNGRAIGNAKCGVYAFFDYDGEPIYVGQTSEQLRTRIRRHLTNRRTDAVAMYVLDPAEVADIEIWPFFELGSGKSAAETLEAAEFTVYRQVLADSALGAVLNEKDIPERPRIDLPASFRARIVPPEVYARLSHPDLRVARRAATVASLARIVAERDVSKGLRRTLLTQTRRLEHLARLRLGEIGGAYPQERNCDET
jgi:hypothetical protein